MICVPSAISCDSVVKTPFGSPVDPDVSFRTAAPENELNVTAKILDLNGWRGSRRCGRLRERGRQNRAGAETGCQRAGFGWGSARFDGHEREVERPAGKKNDDGLGTIADIRDDELSRLERRALQLLGEPLVCPPDIRCRERVSLTRHMNERPVWRGVVRVPQNAQR